MIHLHDNSLALEIIHAPANTIPEYAAAKNRAWAAASDLRGLDQVLHGGFLYHAQRAPEALALTVGDQAWTYAKLADTARRWAMALLRHLPRPPQRVGVFAYRSTVSYAGVLASLFAGAAFVPLNRHFPIERTCAMIDQADLDALIIDPGSLAQFRQLAGQLQRVPPCILIPENDAADLQMDDPFIADRTYLRQCDPLERLPARSASEHAYLLFTSGSTGRPKGVPISHANVLSFIKTNQQRYRITPDDRLTQTFDQTFDLSVFDLFMAWNHGATVCSMPAIQLLAPFRFLRDHGITVWFSVPSVAALLRKQGLLTPGSLPRLRLSLFCGEALPRSTAEAWQAAAPHSVIDNLYGPTELTIACAVYRWDPNSSANQCVNETVPIGRLYPGLKQLIVNDQFEPVRFGEEGELCVAGPQTFEGYWRDEAQTLQRCFTLHEAGGRDLTYYRTGDRVRQLPDGNLVYLGRMDQQIKVQGYRIELGEIEGALSRLPGVVAAAAVGWPRDHGSPTAITAFVVGRDVDPTALLGGLKAWLPAYMLPKQLYVLDAMPLNANGKIDRTELVRRLAADEIPQRPQ
ncbi:MAG TPA: amino acid adenylation domain-containing protein [Herpetosiphonaceae bacterium]|nr:amino acid adenylation domain-containing protein [Herpetosiphonaceae bacterium]